MRKAIQELLDSSRSTSSISQGAGVPWTTVSDLRKGKTSMDKMALLTAEKLYEFATADKQWFGSLLLLFLEQKIAFMKLFIAVLKLKV